MLCNTLTPQEKAAIRVRIRTLEAAYDRLVSGEAVVEFTDQNNERVRYTTANQSKLLELINALKAMVDCNFARRYRPRPIGFIFPR